MASVTRPNRLVRTTCIDEDYLNLDEVEKYDDPNWWTECVRSNKESELKRGIREKPSGLRWVDKNGRTLLHVASQFGSIDIIHLLSELKFDFDAKDEQGKTALHEAVNFNKVHSIHALIEAGADPTLSNNGGLSPLLYAVDLNRHGCVQALLTHADLIDPNSTDESGSTGLHYAAAKNHVESLCALMENGANCKIRNNAGLRVATVAASAGSTEVLQVLCGYARKLNCSLTQCMNSSDANTFLLLHGAVDSGNLETVKVCLNNCANIDALEEDNSTPVHFAAMRGELEILRAMFEAQPERKNVALSLRDKSGMTALHHSVLFDYVEVTRYLLDQGAEIDVPDMTERTAFLLAASKRSVKCVNLLFDRGASVKSVDKDGRNFVHLAVLNGGSMDSYMEQQALFQAMRDLFNERDFYGCTPLHYATIEGHLGAINKLLNSGAHIHVDTHKKATALHFAAKYGRLKTCARLLDSPYGTHIINTADTDGYTAMHMAAKGGHTRVVQLLLERGAIFHRAYCGNTAFNFAAAGGHMRTMKLMLVCNRSLLNHACKSGNTALHLAAQNGHAQEIDYLLTQGAEIRLNDEQSTFLDLALKARHAEVCEAAVKHARWREILSHQTPNYPSPIFGLIEEFPEVCLKVLQRCITNNNESQSSKDYAITYDFSLLELHQPEETNKALTAYDWSNLDASSSVTSKDVEKDQSSTVHLASTKPEKSSAARHFKMIRESRLQVINHMVKFSRVDLLQSPLCNEYLKTKWILYGRRNVVGWVLMHVITMTALTVAAWYSKGPLQCFLSIRNSCGLPVNETCQVEILESQKCAHAVPTIACEYIIFSVTCKRVISQLAIFYTTGIRYFLNLNNVLRTFVVACLLMFSIPTVFSSGKVLHSAAQWNVLAISIPAEFCSFILILSLNGSVGLYVVMFIEIIKTLCKSILIFFMVLFGFALAFTIVFQVPIQSNEDYDMYSEALNFKDPTVSFLRVITMFTGELKFLPLFVNGLTNPHKSQAVPFPITSSLLYIGFTLLVSTAMLNLVVGLAIGDIKMVQHNASLKRLANVCELYTSLEKFCDLLPFLFGRANFRPTSVTVYPNKKCEVLMQYLLEFGLPTNFRTRDKDMASEAADSKQFQQNVTKELLKHKEKIKSAIAAMDTQSELIKLLLKKMDIHYETNTFRDEGNRSKKVQCDIKSIKSNANANWSKLYLALSSEKPP